MVEGWGKNIVSPITSLPISFQNIKSLLKSVLQNYKPAEAL